MNNLVTDRNLLVGILGLQMEFVTESQLISAYHDRADGGFSDLSQRCGKIDQVCLNPLLHRPVSRRFRRKRVTGPAAIQE